MPGEFVTLVTVVGILCGVLFGLLGYQAGIKKDSKHEGAQNGTMHSDIEYIKRRSDETLIELKETNRSLNTLSERVTRVEESAKQAHKRIDAIQGAPVRTERAD